MSTPGGSRSSAGGTAGRQPRRPHRGHSYRRTSAIIDERPDGKPILFGYGRHMTRREKERAQRLIAYAALGLVIALSVLVVVVAAVYQNVIVPNQTVASVNGHGISRRDRDTMTKYFTAQAAQSGGQTTTDPQTLAVQQLQQDLLTKVSAQQQLGLTVGQADANAALSKTLANPSSGGQSAFQSMLTTYNLSKDQYLRLIEEPQVLDQKVAAHLSRNDPKTAEQWHYARIQVKDRKTAEGLLGKLAGGANFAALAKKDSIDTTYKAAGGDSGWERTTDTQDPLLVSTFLKPLQQMQKSHTRYRVVQSGKLWYVIAFLGHDLHRALSASQQQQDQQQAFNIWYSQQKAKANFNPPLPASSVSGGGSVVQSPSQGSAL